MNSVLNNLRPNNEPANYAAQSLVMTIKQGINSQITPSNKSENANNDGITINPAISIQDIWLNWYLSPFSRLSCDTNSIPNPNTIS